MSTGNVIESYLISIGFSASPDEFRKFDTTLKEAANAVEFHTAGIAKQMLTWQASIVGGFMAISGGVLGLADHVAEADLGFQLTGMRMFMTAESAKKLSISLDALGASMEEVAWSPELHARFLQLNEDQDNLKRKLGPGFEGQMRSIRDLGFELKRLHVGIQYLGMAFVSSLFGKFGLKVGDVEKKLEHLNTWLQAHLPQIADKFADFITPILGDAADVAKSFGGALEDSALAFTNLTGVLLGDDSIEGSTLDMKKFAKAIQDASGFIKDLSRGISGAVSTAAHLSSGLALLFGGHYSEAGKEFKAAADASGANDPAIDMTHPLNKPVGYRPSQPDRDLAAPFRSASIPDLQGGRVAERIRNAAIGFGVDPGMALGVARIESGMRQSDRDGNIITSSAGAQGVMQLMPDTAKWLGVDAKDENQNIIGGVELLAEYLSKYHGDETKALEAYNWGPGKLDKALKYNLPIPSDVQQYASTVMGAEDADYHFNRYKNFGGMHSFGTGGNPSENQATVVEVGGITINVTEPRATTEQIASEITPHLRREIRKAMDSQVQREQVQLNASY